MLRFVEPYDKTFSYVLDYVLKVQADMVMDMDKKDYRICYPLSSKYFPKKETRELLLKLQKANKDNTALYFLTDYHFALIYEALDCIGEIRYRGKWKDINVEYITDVYFWDMDFTWEKKLMLDCPMKVKEQMGVSDETFGVIMGLKPHPKEIELKVDKRGDFKSQGYNPRIFDKEE